jgi:predicted O-methyltransferase YrrM
VSALAAGARGLVRRHLLKPLRARRKRLRRAARAGRAAGGAAWQRRYRLTYSRSVARVPVRAELPHVLNRRGLHGRGAEIGVMKGNFSATILREWGGRELLSVDPWLAVPENEQHARQVLAAFGERSRILAMTSVEAAAQVEDGALDFAYIDARHDYDSVRQDLEAWFPKIRPGGILAGHDYPEPGVRAAVDEFFGARGLAVHATGPEPAKGRGRGARRKNPSWIVEIRGAAVAPSASRSSGAGRAATTGSR